MLFLPSTWRKVANNILQSVEMDADSTYLTSRSSFSSIVSAPLPEICASPVSPGFTRSLFFWRSFHSGICETYNGRGPTSVMRPFRMLNNCGSSSSEYSRMNRPMGVSLVSSADFGLEPNGSTSVFIVRNLYSVNGTAFFPALC